MGSHCFVISWVSAGIFELLRVNWKSGVWNAVTQRLDSPETDIQVRPEWPIYLGWVSSKHSDHRVGRLASWKLITSIEYVPRKQGKKFNGYFRPSLRSLTQYCIGLSTHKLTQILKRGQRPSDTQWDFKPSYILF